MTLRSILILIYVIGWALIGESFLLALYFIGKFTNSPEPFQFEQFRMIIVTWMEPFSIGCVMIIWAKLIRLVSPLFDHDDEGEMF